MKRSVLHSCSSPAVNFALSVGIVGCVVGGVLGCGRSGGGASGPGAVATEGPVEMPAAATELADATQYSALAAQTDWPWWRGLNRNGHAGSAALPTKFSSETALWKTPVPGRGHSSPIVVGNRVFLTTADESQQTQSVLAFDRETGKPLWSKEVSRGGFPRRNHSKNTEATSTVACDGERLFATFFHHETVQLSALTLDGEIEWQITAGPFNPKQFEYGYAPSPLLYGDSVIVAAEYDGDSFLAAFDRSSGKEKWRTPRRNNITFSSPVVARVAGREQLVISGANQVASYDPQTGRAIWAVDGTTNATCGTMIWHNDIVIASGGYPKAETLAVRADGSRDVLWRNNQKCYEQSMILVDGFVYALTDGGVLYCWDAESGAEKWKQRLRGPVSSSPILAGGHIYWANEMGTFYVFRPNPERFDAVAENQLGDDSFASPAVSGDRLFLRVGHGAGGGRREMLYCFGAN